MDVHAHAPEPGPPAADAAALALAAAAAAGATATPALAAAAVALATTILAESIAAVTVVAASRDCGERADEGSREGYTSCDCHERTGGL